MISDYELHKHCVEEYYDGYCDECPNKIACNRFIAKYGMSPLSPDLNDTNLCKFNIGDMVTVTELPSNDIYGNEYDEIGGGGEIIDIDECQTTIKLFDGFTIMVDNNNYDLNRKVTK